MDLSINILVVDDMSSMRRIVSNILKKLGFSNITESADGKAAFEEMNSNQFDLIISDWNMPEMTGIELLKNARGMEAYKATPFIMVTAEGQKQNVIEAVQAGVTQYLVKPFTPDQLEEKLKRIYEK